MIYSSARYIINIKRHNLSLSNLEYSVWVNYTVVDMKGPVLLAFSPKCMLGGHTNQRKLHYLQHQARSRDRNLVFSVPVVGS